jgi:polyhydroxybutyrate depolymerase
LNQRAKVTFYLPSRLKNMQRSLRLLIVLLVFAGLSTRRAEADGLQRMSFTVDGVERTALIYVPPAAKTSPTPLVFVFHGHGGSARQVARNFHIEQEWPEAISVYMQGLPTPGQLTDPQGSQPGWQAALGDEGDRVSNSSTPSSHGSSRIMTWT